MRAIHKVGTQPSRRYRRHLRVRRKVAGSAERPRLVVFRSSKHIYAQIVDDGRGVTLVGAADTSEGLRSEEHTSELQSPCNLVCRLLLEKKKTVEREPRPLSPHPRTAHHRADQRSGRAHEADHRLDPQPPQPSHPPHSHAPTPRLPHAP